MQESGRVAALDPDLAERGHVKQANLFAHRHMFGALIVEPVLAVPVVFIFGFLARFGEPVCAFPAGNLAEHRAALCKVLVDRRTAHAAGGLDLTVGVVVGIKQAERLFRPLEKIAPVALKRMASRDIHVAEVERFFALVHPFGKRHPGTSGGLDAD